MEQNVCLPMHTRSNNGVNLKGKFPFQTSFLNMNWLYPQTSVCSCGHMSSCHSWYQYSMIASLCTQSNI